MPVRPDAVAIYIRWSTDEQTDGTTLQTQRERCSLYLLSQGWQVNEDLIFIDEGFSGGNLNRPALTRLRAAVAEELVDCVVTYSMDRLSRSVADTVQLVQGEWAGKCVYRSASQPISTEDGNPTGQLIFNILASFAEFERALIRERTHSGLVRRARQGMYPGTRVPPFGYRRDGKGRLAIDVATADVVRRIFAMAVEGPAGQGPTRIARALMAEGIPAPTGGAWWAHQIRAILTNPVYRGDLVYGRRRVNPAARRNPAAPRRLTGGKPLAVVAGAVPPLVDRDRWEQAQQLFADRAAARTREGLQAKNRSLLAGIARCRCGGPLSLFYGRGGQRYYRCSRHFLSAGGCGADPGVIRADEAESAVVLAVRERFATEGLRQAVAAIAAAPRAAGGPAAPPARPRRSGKRMAESTTPQPDWAAAAARVDLWQSLDVAAQRQVLHGLLRRLIIYKPKGAGAKPEIDFEWEAPV
ncbi:MAG: Resolvase domain protein [Symbiobacteriaceae bacterium]|nr:Resolvase domain protein [Symbiobacteriaceae bacterium]